VRLYPTAGRNLATHVLLFWWRIAEGPHPRTLRRSIFCDAAKLASGLDLAVQMPSSNIQGGQQEGKAMRAERRAVARQIDNVRDSAPDDAWERCRWVRAGIIQEDRDSVGSRQPLVAKPGGGGTELQSMEPGPTSVRPSHCSRAAEDDPVRFEAMPEPRARPNQGGLAFGLEFGEQSEAGADGAELGAQIAGEHPEANGDNGDDNASDQGVFKCRNGPAIGCQSQPDFHLLNHVPAPFWLH
jgi:hypothetical protein